MFIIYYSYKVCFMLFFFAIFKNIIVYTVYSAICSKLVFYSNHFSISLSPDIPVCCVKCSLKTSMSSGSRPTCPLLNLASFSTVKSSPEAPATCRLPLHPAQTTPLAPIPSQLQFRTPSPTPAESCPWAASPSSSTKPSIRPPSPCRPSTQRGLFRSNTSSRRPTGPTLAYPRATCWATACPLACRPWLTGKSRAPSRSCSTSSRNSSSRPRRAPCTV